MIKEKLTPIKYKEKEEEEEREFRPRNGESLSGEKKTIRVIGRRKGESTVRVVTCHTSPTELDE